MCTLDTVNPRERRRAGCTVPPICRLPKTSQIVLLFALTLRLREPPEGDMVERLAMSYSSGRVMPISTVVMGTAKWNQVIHVMDGDDFWATDPESNLYDKAILRYLIYQ